jgi:uncharacterized protein (DUF1330 family)
VNGAGTEWPALPAGPFDLFGQELMMPAYLLVEIEIRDPSWLAAYQHHVPAIMHKHGGEYLAASESVKRYEGDGPDPDGIAIFTFPSVEAIDAFLSDADYLPFKAARRAASSGNLFAFTSRS